MAPTVSFRLVLAITLFLLGTSHSELEVKPFQVAVEPRETIIFTCSYSKVSTNQTLQLTWTYTNSSHSNLTLPELVSSHRIHHTNGTLTIKNITMEDAGSYTCTDNQGSAAQMGLLVVYHMPDYMLEIAVVASLCCLLLLVLIAGVAICFSIQRKKIKARMTTYLRSL